MSTFIYYIIIIILIISFTFYLIKDSNIEGIDIPDNAYYTNNPDYTIIDGISGIRWIN